MDRLWKAGLRPTEGSGSAGALSATQHHLEDMRSLVFRREPEDLKNYEELWEAAEPHTPEMRCEPYEGMPPNIAGQLVTKWESDEQHDAYSAIHKEIRETEQRIEEQAEEMLKRLAAVRLYMWT